MAAPLLFDSVRITMKRLAGGPNENVQPTELVQAKNEPSKMIVQEIEKPHKLEAGPIMRQVMSAGSMYPAHFVSVGSNLMKMFNPAAQKIPVKNRQCEEPKRGKGVQVLLKP
ncbi:hypothetical protein CAEBREN_17006 [Caenorhabditis brenneri]|uniref:Uncharacterized protein n=1 Tax=Caenorhabditis brenneri TaxID=135651 RepID=G0P1W2_CAEBE|nr:hypothetical protein CAEBREN_17006 [Caenorhabditis brenneri]